MFYWMVSNIKPHLKFNLKVKFGLPLSFLGIWVSLLLSACSFQSHTPAPVVNLNSNTPSVSNKNNYARGTLTSDKYQVRQGDTLYSISWAANKNFVDIAKSNNLKAPYTIYPGQVLNLNLTKKTSTSQKADLSVKAPTKVVPTSSNTVKKQPVKPVSKQVDGTAAVAKKPVDPPKKTAYPETTNQQKNNKTNNTAVNSTSKTASALPEKVYKWHWPVKGKLISRFSATEQGNKGIKIAGSRGDRIKAAADGRVVYAGNALRGYGNLVIIKHSDDYLSAYAHADKILVKEKQFVTAGQTVANMGSTGTNQVMLHFEIRYHGQSVDPLKYLPK